MNRIDLIINNFLFKDQLNKIVLYEKSRIFCGHDLEHLLSVARIMIIKNLESQLGFQKEIIYSTALLHDIGRFKEYNHGVPHAVASADLSEKILVQCDFSDNEISLITSAILSHNSKGDCSPLGQLLRSSDKLSRNCFACSAISECKWSQEKMNNTIKV